MLEEEKAEEGGLQASKDEEDRLKGEESATANSVATAVKAVADLAIASSPAATQEAPSPVPENYVSV